LSRVDVLGVGFDNLTRENAIEKCKQLIEKHCGAYMVTPNPEIVMAAWDNKELKDALSKADLVIPDGIGVVKAAKIIGTPLKERLPGIEIGEAILEYAANSGKKVFLLGAKPGVADAAAEKMKNIYPGLNICGTNDGYFKEDDPVIAKINMARPDFLMVCLGAPKQELWMSANSKKLDVGLMAGLGGSLDVFAGNVMRAPKIWQKLNAEWLYRCIKEPWRFKRIARLPLFIIKAWMKRIRKLFNGKR
jgi:N-acetylglucosaminyldiphosphoundecaprenol N-acetyl-beta-D-mannosaminyltransferase